jgi:adenylylsulfate kinase
MNLHSEHISPVFDRMLSRKQKEQMLQQHSVCIWFTGLSGSGKSTLALALEKELYQKGYLVSLLDGDNVRTGINNNLGFSEFDRIENLRRIAEINKLFLSTGVITLNSFVSPTESLRQFVEEIIGKHQFFLIYVKTSLEECEKRDVKGFYAKARKGEIENFTGISAPFEEPSQQFLILDTTKSSVNECIQQLIKNILPLIEFKTQ